MTFLSELWKKAKFFQVNKTVEEQQCPHCDHVIILPEDTEKETEQLIILIFFNRLEHNQFACYVTDESGRNTTASFEEINRLHLQWTQAYIYLFRIGKHIK